LSLAGTAGTERKTDRLEAFTDAVLAIAITLPVTELEAPRVALGGDLGGAFAALAPGYVAYGLSGVVIGLYWAHSHFSGKIIEKTDHWYNLLTIAFLAAVSVTPFPTRPFVEHAFDPRSGGTAVALYAGLLAAPAIIWLLRWTYAVRRGLLDPRLDADYVRRVTRRYRVTAAVLSLAAVAAATTDWRWVIAVSAIATLTYVFPPHEPAYLPGEAPRDELEEPDERRG